MPKTEVFDQPLKQFAASPTGVLALLTAIAGGVSAVISALITVVLGKYLVTLSARDKQDREVEWRSHAAKLTKLDLERKLKSWKDFRVSPLRPSIMDFLANYRDLQALGARSPTDLYIDVESRRTIRAPAPPVSQANASKSSFPGLDCWVRHCW